MIEIDTKESGMFVNLRLYMRLMLADLKKVADESDAGRIEIMAEGFNDLCDEIEAEEKRYDEADLDSEEEDKISVAQVNRYFNAMRNLKSGLTALQSMTLNPAFAGHLQDAIDTVEGTYIAPMLAFILEEANLPRDEKELLVVVRRL